MDVEKIFCDLESNQTRECEESKKKLVELFSQTKDNWLVYNMLDYFLKTGSLRIMEVLVKVQSPHDVFIFERLDDWLKSTNRVQALNVLCFVVRRHPTWLFKIEKHRLIKDMFKLLTHEKDIIPLMSALLCIITLLPIIPNLVPNFLNDLFEVFGHLASWKLHNSNRLPDDKLVHLQLGLQMLFHRLYGMYPCNFLAFLSEFIKKDKGGGIFQHTIKPLLETVRVHPMLLTATIESEVSNSRWKEMEPHDVVMECAQLSLPVVHQDFNNDHSSSYPITPSGMRSTPSISRATSNTSNSDNYSIQFKDLQQMRGSISHFEANENNSAIIWSPYNEINATGPIPLTPTPSYILPLPLASSTQLLGVTGSSPPEAAVEATPETTPMKDLKVLKFQGQSGAASSLANPNAVRAIFVSSQPSSPMRRENNQFSFPDVGNATEADSITISTLEKEISTQRLPRITTTYDRRLQQVKHDRTQHAQSAFQTIEALSAKRDNIRSPIDASVTSDSPEIDAEICSSSNNIQNNLTSTPPATPITTPILIPHDEHITKVCGECNETERNLCSAGGLHMPTSRSMQQFAKGMKRRKRMSSDCYNDSSCEKVNSSMKNDDIVTFSIIERIKRRTKSCSAICSIPLAHKSDEEEADVNLKSENGLGKGELLLSMHKSGARLQKSGKMLAIAASAHNQQLMANISYCNAATQTLETVPQDYENSLFELLFECKDLRNSYDSKLMYPQEILDQYISKTIQAKENFESAYPYQEQYQLLCLQLQYERYRRGIHAERNRRLMGRSRDKRSLEMERDRLREQMKNYAAKNKELVQQMDKTMKLHNERQLSYNDEIAAVKAKYQSEHEQNKYLRQANDDLKIRLNEEQIQRKEMTYELESLRGQIFNLDTELQLAQQQASIGFQYKQELSRLEAEFIVMGEVQVKCRDRLSEIDNFRARDEELQILQDSYNIEIKEMKCHLEEKISQLDIAKQKISELQTQLINNEKAITEQKRLLRTVKDEYEKMFEAVNRKYEVQKKIIMQMEEKFIMSLQKPQAAIGQNTCSPDTDRTDIASSMERNSPLSTSLASSESLSVSLRSTELRNLQQLVETLPLSEMESSGPNVVGLTAVPIIEGTRIPTLDLAASANTATGSTMLLPTASAITIMQPNAAYNTPSSSTNNVDLASTTSHIHPHLHLQRQYMQQQQNDQQQSQHQKRL